MLKRRVYERLTLIFLYFLSYYARFMPKIRVFNKKQLKG